MSEVLGVPVERADADFFSLGGDEASSGRLLDLIDEDAGVRLHPATVREHSTVRELAGRIATSRAARRGRVVGFGTDRPGRPLFCVMQAFQARVVGRGFIAVVDRPFYVVQRAGLEGRGKPDRTVRARARRAVRDIRSVQPVGPYTIAGYCSDGWVAFEAARLLTAAGETVDLAIVIDIWAPVYDRFTIGKLRMQTRWQRATEWETKRGFLDLRRRCLFLREIKRDYAEKVKWFVLGLPAGFLQYPTTKQSKVMFELSSPYFNGYRPDPVDFDLTLVRGQPFGGHDWAVRRAAPDMAWGQMTSRHVEVVSVSGDHMSMLECESGRELGATLARLVTARAASTRKPAPLTHNSNRSAAPEPTRL